MTTDYKPSEHERHLLGISQGWQEASDYALKKANEAFLARNDKEAIALRNIAYRMRETSQSIFMNIENMDDEGERADTDKR